MAAGVVAIGRHRYAVGLYWENSPGGGRVAQIAKEAAKQPGQQADFFTVRPGNKDGRVPQFGLCTSEGRSRSGDACPGCLPREPSTRFLGGRFPSKRRNGGHYCP